MPTASAYPARSTGTGAPRARPRGRGQARRPGAGVRWDRLGRVAMLCVLVALLYLYLSAGAHMFSTWRQSRHDHALVSAMEREHRSLVSQHETLVRRGTLEGEARRLGMMNAGEQPYVVSGLPQN
jgi:hypothetical protein